MPLPHASSARLAAILGIFVFAASLAAQPPAALVSFIDQHCASRNDDLEKEAGLEDGDSLLGRSTMLYGSKLGNAYTQSCLNHSTILACGGFR
jgi:hypothetical protein